MVKLTLMILLLAIPFAFSACDTAYINAMDKMGYAKRDLLSSRVKSARDAQADAKKDIQSALDQFGQVVTYQGGDLEAIYKKLKSELQRSEDSAETVRNRIEAVENVADSLFAEWKTELGQYSNADLRRRSEAKQRIDPVLRPLRDHVLYLKHNLNARALAAMKGELVKVDAQVDQLVREMNRSIAEADKFIQIMEREPD
jgi:hypothetical protein